ncbi:uncharacterized protein RJT20DRAFT_53083 [Scheffersomyces xylosifermentans]|uniref:uncharacterized protein n=1 Tax=Scheffersomyces xylosifermentans TaxID=1304137 RepID=UPI00315DC846
MSEVPLSLQLNEDFDLSIPVILPHDKVFSIQVGYKLFRLSGLSLSSDAPSYFTKFFNQPGNTEKVLFIDRNPVIFEKIYNHLQGYSLNVDSDYEFVHLWSDSYYFGLKRLQVILTDQDIFATIGDQSFKMSKSLFSSTGNFPNYFSVNYETLFTNNINIIEEKNMLRPPPQRPATVSNRSPLLFSDLLEILRGNNLIIKNDEHRQLLIRECKYYRFLELEQRIIKHRIINNPFMQNKQEIIINLNDLQKKGISNNSPMDKSLEVPISYTRPYIAKEPARNLIFQIEPNGDILNKNYSEVKILLNKSLNMATVQITNKLCSKMLQVFKDFKDDFMIQNLGTDTPSVIFFAGFSDCKAIINGMQMKNGWIYDLMGSKKVDAEQAEDMSPTAKKRKLDPSDVQGDVIEIKISKSLWRMVMRGDRSRLHAVSIEGETDHSSFIKKNIDFL